LEYEPDTGLRLKRETIDRIRGIQENNSAS
jgi:hypothetical protein